jgi:hypothetical protein
MRRVKNADKWRAYGLVPVRGDDGKLKSKMVYISVFDDQRDAARMAAAWRWCYHTYDGTARSIRQRQIDRVLSVGIVFPPQYPNEVREQQRENARRIKQQPMNKPGSEFEGVEPRPNGKWRARYGRVTIGNYDNMEQAAAARCFYISKHGKRRLTKQQQYYAELWKGAS